MLKPLEIKKKKLKAARHHLIEHTHFLDNSILFSGTDIFFFPFPVREIEANFSLHVQWSNSSPTIFPKGASSPRHHSWGSSLKVLCLQSPAPHCRSWAFPVGLFLGTLPLHPGQNGTHWTVPGANQMLSVRSTQSAAWVWCQPLGRTNRKDFGVTAVPVAQLALLWVLYSNRRLEKNSWRSSFGSNSTENIKEAQAITGNFTS